MDKDAVIDDETLLRRFVDEGDRSALGELAKRYEAPLLALASSILAGYGIAPGVAWEESCDLVQEVWVQVIRHGGSFQNKSRFKTWIYRVVVNQCKNRSAALGRQRGGIGRLLDLKRMKMASVSSVIAGENNNPTAWLERLDEQHELIRGLAYLGWDQRDVLLLCYHCGMTHSEAADILEIPVGTLKSRLHVALSELRQHLQVHVEERVTTDAAMSVNYEVNICTPRKRRAWRKLKHGWQH